MKNTLIATCCVVISMLISIFSVNSVVDQQEEFTINKLALFSSANAEDLPEIVISCDETCAKNARCWGWAYEYCPNLGGYEGLCFANGQVSSTCSSPCC